MPGAHHEVWLGGIEMEGGGVGEKEKCGGRTEATCFVSRINTGLSEKRPKLQVTGVKMIRWAAFF